MPLDRTLSDKQIRSMFEMAFASGEWFMFPRALLYVLSFGEAIMLSHLINKARSVKAEEKEEGWFYCLMSNIVEDLHISSDSQTRLFNSLKQKAYIKTELRGLPAKRWIWIDFAKLVKDIDKASHCGLHETAFVNPAKCGT